MTTYGLNADGTPHVTTVPARGYGTAAEHVSAVRRDRMADYAADMRLIGWLIVIVMAVLSMTSQNDGITDIRIDHSSSSGNFNPAAHLDISQVATK